MRRLQAYASSRPSALNDGVSVPELVLDDERLERRSRDPIEEIQLRSLVAALVDREENAVAGRYEEPGHRLGEIGHLHWVAVVRRRDVELKAARQVPADEHVAAVGDVGGERPADLEQLPERRHRR